jgi:hypothetical protein
MNIGKKPRVIIDYGNNRHIINDQLVDNTNFKIPFGDNTNWREGFKIPVGDNANWRERVNEF